MKTIGSYRIRCYLWAMNAIIAGLCMFYHELWHWLMAWIMRIITLGKVSDIKLHILGHPSISINEFGGFTTASGTMRVSHYSTYRFSKSYGSVMITFAPAIGVIFLFIISPWQLWAIYLVHLDSLWLSATDIKTIQSFKSKTILYE